MNSKALATVLSGKLRDAELIVVEKFNLEEKKTKKMAAALKNLQIKGSILLSFSDSEKEMTLTSQNLPKVKNIFTSQLNVLDILDKKNLIMTKESAKYLENKYKK